MPRISRELREIQRTCAAAEAELQAIEARLEAARDAIVVPPNLEMIWWGRLVPTVDIEVHGCLSIVLADYLPETRRILRSAATVTTRSVSLAWRDFRGGITTHLAPDYLEDDDPEDDPE
jgi:hypothetical protein